MKKALSLLLSLLLALSMAGCSQTEITPDEPDTTTEVQQPEVPKADETTDAEVSVLQWAEEVPDLIYEPDWTVETTSEDFLLELTDPKYEGRATGSTGNRAAADWIESQFIQMGLQKLPDLDSYRQIFRGEVYEILPGYAAIVSADGTETELELGVDWVYRPSYEEIDLTLPLSADLTSCEAGTAFLDADKTTQETPRQYIEVVSGDASAGVGYITGNETASRITVTPEVYETLNQEGIKLHLKLPMGVQEGEADNVVAYIPGEDSTKLVLISAHFDGSGQCGTLMPSAYDNASGVAAMLQTASWLSKAESLPCDVILAAFNGEESGMEGSSAFSRQIGSKYEQILVVNIDCVGWRDNPLTIYGETASATLRDDLAGGMGIQYKEEHYSGDQISFSKPNMLAVTITQDASMEDEAIRAILHSTYDTVENLDSTMLDDLAKDLCAWVIERGGNTLSIFYPIIW